MIEDYFQQKNCDHTKCSELNMKEGAYCNHLALNFGEKIYFIPVLVSVLQALQYTKQNDTKPVFPQSAWIVPYVGSVQRWKKVLTPLTPSVKIFHRCANLCFCKQLLFIFIILLLVQFLAFSILKVVSLPFVLFFFNFYKLRD